jgi:hypothetical protein
MNSPSLLHIPNEAVSHKTAPQMLSIVRRSSRVTLVRTEQPSELDRSRGKAYLAGTKRRSVYLCTRPEPLPPIKDSISDRVE